VVEQKLNPAGAPSSSRSRSKGKDLEFVAVFEVFPEFVAGFDSITVERLSASG
jgi:trigger factor